MSDFDHYFEVCGDKNSIKDFLASMDKEATLNQEGLWGANYDPMMVWDNGVPPKGELVVGANIDWVNWDWQGVRPKTDYIEELSRQFDKLDFVMITLRDIAILTCNHFKNGDCVHGVCFYSPVMNYHIAVGEAYSHSNDPTKYERIRVILDEDFLSFSPDYDKFALEIFSDEDFDSTEGWNEILEMNDLFLLNRILKNIGKDFLASLNTEQMKRVKSIKKTVKTLTNYKGELGGGIGPLEWDVVEGDE